MKIKKKVIVLLISLLLASTTINALNSQTVSSDEKMVLDDGIKDFYIEITKPKIGYLCVFGNCFLIPFLTRIKFGVIIDYELNVETKASETVDSVEFTLRFNQSSDINNYKINVTKSPFNCCFEDIPTGFNYMINATAYNNSKMVAWDVISPIVYIRIPTWDTP